MENISFIQTLYKHRIDTPSSYTGATQISKVTSDLEVFPLIIIFRLIRKRLTMNKIKLLLDKAKYNPDTLSGPMLSVGVEHSSLKSFDVLGNYEIYDHDTDKV